MHRAASVSSRRPSRPLIAAALAVAFGLTGCSAGHGRAQPAATLPPGTITVDRWIPPVLSGGPSTSNFCTALTAVYQHMADLQHVVSKKVAEDMLSDYVSYAPTVIAESPPDMHTNASLYIGAVSSYLHDLVVAGLDLGHLRAGALQPLANPRVNAAYSSLYGYSQTECHYTIGGSSTPS